MFHHVMRMWLAMFLGVPNSAYIVLTAIAIVKSLLFGDSQCNILRVRIIAFDESMHILDL